jgi:hypothetical protein
VDRAREQGATTRNSGHDCEESQSSYEELTGWKAQAAGGPPARMLDAAQRAEDRAARVVISRELGHEREQITSVGR